MLLLLVLFIAVVSASPLLPYRHACLAGALAPHSCMHMRAGWAENQRTLELANKRHACYSPLPLVPSPECMHMRPLEMCNQALPISTFDY